MIRKRGGSLQVQVFAGRDPLTGRKRWLSRQVRRQTKAARRQAKKVEAQLLEQLDRGEQRGSRTRTVGEVDAATLDTLDARVRATGGKCRHCWTPAAVPDQ